MAYINVEYKFEMYVFGVNVYIYTIIGSANVYAS